MTDTDRLKIAVSNLENIQPHKISSPPYQPRRASVAILIRINPKNSSPDHDESNKSVQNEGIDHDESNKPIQNEEGIDHDISNKPVQIEEIDDLQESDPKKKLEKFWNLPWVRNGDPEILYIKRALRKGDRWSGQVAFPGGKQDVEDIDDLDTSERETFEEVGLDLGNNKLFMCIGALDDREVTSTFGKNLQMVLCPFVFLQLTKMTPPIEISGSEVQSTHWIPLSIFFDPTVIQKRDLVSIDLSSRLAPDSWVLQNIFKTLIGRMHFHCIELPHTGEDGTAMSSLQLWGLTLQMTSDLIDMMYEQNELPPRRLDAKRPKFDYCDVNFFAWCFLSKNRKNYKRKMIELRTRRIIWAEGWREYFMAVQKSCIIATLIRTVFFLLFIKNLPSIFFIVKKYVQIGIHKLKIELIMESLYKLVTTYVTSQIRRII